MTPAEYHMGLVASTGCVICRRLDYGWVPGCVHHVAEGSSKRSDFATVCLCPEHHDGHGGFHRLHSAFLLIHKVPWLKEEGLLVFQNEDLALLAMGRLELGVA